MNAVVPIQAPTNAEAYRASTDAAGLCREIVKSTAKNIQGRRYVAVEGWEAIAIAHGCAASAMDVERVSDEGMSGFKCVGVVRRMMDGQEIARAEGFLGDDEAMWSKRPVYARRAMVQTRAISRACRSAFAHVVVMIDANLSTTPAEEVPNEGFGDARVSDHAIDQQPNRDEPAPREKLEGKYPSKSKLQSALREFVTKLLSAETAEAVDELEAEYQEALVQCQRDLPVWWTGDGSPEKRGVAGQIADKRESFGGMLAELLRSMRECETLKSFTGWCATNEVVIDSLNDLDRRRFERERDQFESGLTLVAQRN